MIDTVLYRCRIGLFQHRTHSPKNSRSKIDPDPRVMYRKCGVFNININMFIFYMIYTFFIIYSFTVSSLKILSSTAHTCTVLNRPYINFSYRFSDLADSQSKLLFVILLAFVVKRCLRHKPYTGVLHM